MTLKQPNTVCKNRDCTKGTDGGRKHYFACLYCTHSENWRSMACSWECYLAYQDQVREARQKSEPIDEVSERLDMTREEVVALIEDTPTELVVEQTNIELADEIEEHPSFGFGELVDAINEELDNQK